jgi:hypothetical protein
MNLVSAIGSKLNPALGENPDNAMLSKDPIHTEHTEHPEQFQQVKPKAIGRNGRQMIELIWVLGDRLIAMPNLHV